MERYLSQCLSLFMVFPLFLGNMDRAEARITKTIKVTPQIRTLPLEESMPLFSQKEMASLTEDHLFIDQKAFLKAPLVTAIEDQRLVAGQNDRVYAPNLTENKTQDFVICDKGTPLVHPETGEKLGFSVITLAKARLESDSILRLTEVKGPIMAGMRVFPHPAIRDEIPEKPEVNTTKDLPSTPQEGTILSVQENSREIGQRDLVIVSLGKRESLKKGHFLDVYSSSLQTQHQKKCTSCRKNSGKPTVFPEYKKGQLLILKTEERVSLALVTEAKEPIHLRDVVRTP